MLPLHYLAHGARAPACLSTVPLHHLVCSALTRACPQCRRTNVSYVPSHHLVTAMTSRHPHTAIAAVATAGSGYGVLLSCPTSISVIGVFVCVCLPQILIARSVLRPSVWSGSQRHAAVPQQAPQRHHSFGHASAWPQQVDVKKEHGANPSVFAASRSRGSAMQLGDGLNLDLNVDSVFSSVGLGLTPKVRPC
jgi:hypothetical protein